MSITVRLSKREAELIHEAMDALLATRRPSGTKYELIRGLEKKLLTAAPDEKPAAKSKVNPVQRRTKKWWDRHGLKEGSK